MFTELIRDIGVKGVQVEELYSLDAGDFNRLSPVYGLIFLFKWDPNVASDARSSSTSTNVPDPDVQDLFFAKQVINNACATQAILSILMNSPELELGETLSEFKGFTQSFPPDLKGLAISNCDKIREAHNSFTHPEPFVMEQVKATSSDDVYHFVAYLPFRGKVYELDGLQDAPICLGEINTSWFDVVRPALEKRFERYAASEIRFNLLALIQNRQDICQEKILELMEQPETTQRLAEIENLKATIQMEKDKFSAWHVENIRRKHNYLPFVVQLLKVLAKKGQLQPLVERANSNSTSMEY